MMTTDSDRMIETWEALISAWCSYLVVAGKAEGTIKLRRYHVARFAAAFPDGPLTIGFESMVEWLAERQWGANTRRSYRASLRVFWEWLVATGRTRVSPAHQLPSVKPPRLKPKPTPEAGVAIAVRDADDFYRLAVMLAGYCGMRRGEIARARKEDMVDDLIGRSLRVVGKGGHERLVPLPDEVVREILRHDPGWLFPSPKLVGKHITAHHLAKVITSLLPEGYSTHSLRHRCGTIAYAGSKDVFAVQELLGHARTETTKMYVEIAPESVRAAMMCAAPGGADLEAASPGRRSSAA